MDAIDIKLEKDNAISRYNRLQNITNLFRFMEVCIFLFITSKISTQFPFSFNLSGDYFRRTIFSPGFIFIIGNAIVLVLFLKYGQFSAQESINYNTHVDFCSEDVENCENRLNVTKTGEVKKQGNQSICEEKEVVPDFCIFEEVRKMQRSQSEDLKKYENEDSGRKLRRTVTERCRKSVNYGGNEGVKSYAEDKMSGEEFRRMVEAFIARQQKSLREEEFSAMVTPGE